jgi:HSP20 family protein
MQSIDQALREAQSLHERLTGMPAPELPPQAFFPFPPGQDPVAFAIGEVARLKQMIDSGRAADGGAWRPHWVPSASIYAGDTSMSIVVELPGVGKDDLSVSVIGAELVVRGRRQPTAEGGLRPLVVEQAWGAFERRFPLPAWADAESITARYSQGMLEIVVGRTGDDGSSEIRVKID